jgi:hypothetical protein
MHLSSDHRPTRNDIFQDPTHEWTVRGVSNFDLDCFLDTPRILRNFASLVGVSFSLACLYLTMTDDQFIPVKEQQKIHKYFNRFQHHTQKLFYSFVLQLGSLRNKLSDSCHHSRLQKYTVSAKKLPHQEGIVRDQVKFNNKIKKITVSLF